MSDSVNSGHAITIREESLPEKPADLLSIIARVVSDPTIDVEKMERLLAMQERVQAEQKKVAFMAAMARLQEAIPQINKYGQAKNSKYAKLEDIDVTIRPLLAAEGFSVSFDEESHTDKTVTFIMTFSHREGHAESKRLTVPIDAAAKNREGQSIRPAIQDAGSTVSYARRYMLKMHLNLIETNEDTDGESLKPITDEEARDIEALITEVGADKKRFLAFMGAESVEAILARDHQKAINALQTKRRAK